VTLQVRVDHLMGPTQFMGSLNQDFFFLLFSYHLFCTALRLEYCTQLKRMIPFHVFGYRISLICGQNWEGFFPPSKCKSTVTVPLKASVRLFEYCSYSRRFMNRDRD
jgi:hypothetical protein